MASAVKLENIIKEKPEPYVPMETDNCEELEDGELSCDDDDVIAPLAEVESTLFDSGELDIESRAKRFSLFGDTKLAVPKEELQQLYDSLGIDEENERHYRFNTVHLRGTDKLETEDIFEYFSGLEPTEVIWLDSGACNVQWEDEILPARALLYLSVQIINVEKRYKRENAIAVSDSDEEDVLANITGNVVDACKLPFSLPPGRWRKGQSCEKSKKIIMRYASKDDKKLPQHVVAENPMYRGQYSHTRAKKSKHKAIRVEHPSKNPWGPLAQTWGRGEGVERIMFDSAPIRNLPDLRSSLKDMEESRFVDIYLRRAAEIHRKRPPSPPVFEESSDSDSSNDEFRRRRKLPKMKADIEEERVNRVRLEKAARNKDLRNRITHNTPRVKVEIPDDGDDLVWARENYSDLKMTLANRNRDRDSLSSDSSDLGVDEPGEMLQIEVDNEYCRQDRRRRH